MWCRRRFNKKKIDLQVLSAAHAGFTPAEGVELNPWLVIYSKVQALRQGFSSTTSFHRKDLWKFSLKPYPNIVIFGVEEMVMLFFHIIQFLNYFFLVWKKRFVIHLLQISDGGAGDKIRKWSWSWDSHSCLPVSTSNSQTCSYYWLWFGHSVALYPQK